MKARDIHRIDFKNKKSDFEIVDLQHFFASRPKAALEQDSRVNFWSLLYVSKGQGYHYIDFEAYAYEKGDVIIIQKDQVHKYRVHQEVEGYMIHINEPFFYRVQGFDGDIFLEFVDRAFGRPVFHLDQETQETTSVLMALMARVYRKDSVNLELIASLFQGLVLAIRDQEACFNPGLMTKDYEHFKKFRRTLELHYRSHRQVEDYALMMGLSKKTINQATRHVLDRSAKAFITQRVILEIKRYLSQGRLKTYEIADRLGFEEAANMTKFFKQDQGLSPKAFKDALGKPAGGDG